MMLPKVSDSLVFGCFLSFYVDCTAGDYTIFVLNLLLFVALPGEYVDMVKAGIIDPLKVIRTALVDAAR